jgi:hypothetical protein
MVDGILKNAMPKWNDEDKSVYFIRGHVGGSLVAKMKELKVLDLWFTPIFEFEEVKSDWVKQHHLDYYHKEGIMRNEPKQETMIKTDNVLIAEFMGLTIITDGISLFDSDYKALKKYNESWDSLMPVVEKIEASCNRAYQFKIYRNQAFVECTVMGDRTILTSQKFVAGSDYKGVNSKIANTYQAVVEFIKWYNQQKV